MGVNAGHDFNVTRRAQLVAAMLAMLLASPPALSETLEQRLHRLEAELQELRSTLSQQQQQNADSAEEPAPVAITAQSASPASQSSAYVRYFIQDEPLGVQPPDNNSALASGRFSDLTDLSFDPRAYDVKGTGIFSPYRDPAEYRYAGLELQADMRIDEEGEYEFVVYPRPARDGGTNVLTRLSLHLSIGKEPVISFQNESSWRPWRSRILLKPGLYRLRLWAVAASDGFGPSPTESRLRLVLKGPNDVSPQPLRNLQAPSQPE